MIRDDESQIRHGVTDPEIRKDVPDLDELRSLMADFTPEQRAEVLGAASRAAQNAHARLLADRVLAECPEAPPCPAWCTEAHEAVNGWDEIEQLADTRAPASAAKTCSANVGLAATDDGSIMVSLDRLAVSDVGAGRWGAVHICEPVVVLHPDLELERVTIENLDALQRLLYTARELIVGTKR